MAKIVRYTIRDTESFISGLMSKIDTSVTLSDLSISRSEPGYYGKIEWSKIIIFDQIKYFFQNRIILSAVGEIHENMLSLKVRLHNYWIHSANFTFLTLLSLFLFINLNKYFGILLLIINIIQISYVLILFNKSRDKFVTMLDRLTKD